MSIWGVLSLSALHSIESYNLFYISVFCCLRLHYLYVNYVPSPDKLCISVWWLMFLLHITVWSVISLVLLRGQKGEGDKSRHNFDDAAYCSPIVDFYLFYDGGCWCAHVTPADKKSVYSVWYLRWPLRPLDLFFHIMKI